jgi:hypothetical protein
MTRRGRLAEILGLLFLAGCLVAAAHAIAQLVAGVPGIPLFPHQFVIWVAVVLLMVCAIPASSVTMASDAMRLRPERFRAALTGPFAEIARPYRRPVRYFLRFSQLVFLALVAILFFTHAFLPAGLWVAALMCVRFAAYDGSAIAAQIEQVIGTRPKLRRNRRRNWSRAI